MQTKLNIKSSSSIFIANSASLKIADLIPTYAIGRSVVSVNEGVSVTFTLSTTNVVNGNSVPYTITGISANDLTSGSLTGSFTVNKNLATVMITASADQLTEGAETATITLDNNAASNSVLINDTSVTPEASGPILFYDAADSASYPGTGTTIYDLTTNSLNGVLVGGPTFNNVSGNKYFTWTTGDYLYTPTLDESSVVKALTGDRPQHSVEVWSYPTVSGRIMFTYNGTATENNNYHFSAMELAGGKAYFGLWTSPGGLVSTPTPANNVSTSAWHQFVLVYDGTTIIGYVDGVEQSRTTADVNFKTPYEGADGNLRMMFGAFSSTNSGGSSQRFSGRWRKMRVYKRALTANQVLANYNAG